VIHEGGIESHTPAARRLAALLALALLAALVVGLGIAGPGAAPALAGTTCANADAGIGDAKAKQLARAVKCLINEDRFERNKRRVRANGMLRTAAAKHNRAMLQGNCWSHKCPGEPALGKRIRQTGYLDGAREWRFGELFGCHTTPQEMVDRWLSKQFGRKQIRRPSYRDIGVAAKKQQVEASNCDDGDEVTYTIVLAYRVP